MPESDGEGEPKTFEIARYVTDSCLKCRDKWNSILETQSAEFETWTLALLHDCVQVSSDEDLRGWNPCHVASLVGDIPVISQLLEREPESVNAFYVDSSVTPLMCAAFGGHLECVEFLLAKGAQDVTKHPKLLLNWLIKGGNADCCRKLLVDHKVIGSCLNKALDLCWLIESGVLSDRVAILKIILEDNILAAFQTNQNGDSTLVLAVQKGLKNIIRHLIKIKVPVDSENNVGQTSLHRAVQGSSVSPDGNQLNKLPCGPFDFLTDESSLATLEILLDNCSNINHLDDVGFSPLDYAANKGFSKCVFKLIEQGAHIPSQTLARLNEKIPGFVQAHLNSLISMRGVSQCNSKILIAINLRLTGTMNDSTPTLRETSFLNFLISDGQWNFLTHPAIETFLTVKWIFVRKYFMFSSVLYIILLSFYSSFIMEAYINIEDDSMVPGNYSAQDSTGVSSSPSSPSPSLLWWLSLSTICLRILASILTLVINPNGYIRRKENWVLWFIIMMMMLTHVNPSTLGTKSVPNWQNKTASISILLAWIFFLHYLRRQPTLGIYVEMLVKVLKNVAKFILTYTCLLFGFAISFMVLYKKKEPFINLVSSVLRVLNMMVGEMSYETLFDVGSSAHPIEERSVSHVVYAIFVITVTVALINLLIGLAVSDIKGLRKRSKIHKIMQEVAFISNLEFFITSPKLQKLVPTKLYSYIQRSMQLPPAHHTIHVFPNNSNDKRLHRELKMEALAIAMQNELETNEKIKSDNSVEAQLHKIQSQLGILLEARKKKGLRLGMSLVEKRSSYKCGHKYVRLPGIQTWSQYVQSLESVLPPKGLLGVNFVVSDELNSKVSIWQGDITTLEIDAIVNSANSSLLGDAGGNKIKSVDSKIHFAAGNDLLEECKQLQGCEVGQAKITGGYQLPAKYVIHAVGPRQENTAKLFDSYNNSLNCMVKHNLRSIGFPCIATGNFGYPSLNAAHVALQTVRTFLKANIDKVDRVIFCLYSKKDMDIYLKLMQHYFPVSVPANVEAQLALVHKM